RSANRNPARTIHRQIAQGHRWQGGHASATERDVRGSSTRQASASGRNRAIEREGIGADGQSAAREGERAAKSWAAVQGDSVDVVNRKVVQRNHAGRNVNSGGTAAQDETG